MRPRKCGDRAERFLIAGVEEAGRGVEVWMDVVARPS